MRTMTIDGHERRFVWLAYRLMFHEATDTMPRVHLAPTPLTYNLTQTAVAVGIMKADERKRRVGDAADARPATNEPMFRIFVL